jgi:hypothetical protein
MCDVATFGRASGWKPVDRLAATAFVGWQGCKLAWLEMSAAEGVVWCATLAVGLLCFQASMACLKLPTARPSRRPPTVSAPPTSSFSSAANSHQAPQFDCAEKDADAVPDLRLYLKWHTAWHCSLPLGAALWLAVRANRLGSLVAAAH